jgi:hypothetical protein
MRGGPGVSQQPDERDEGFQTNPPRKVESGVTAGKPPGPPLVRASPLRQALRWWPALPVVLLLGGCAGLTFFAYNCNNPRDWVVVSVTNLPGPDYYVCVVSESRGERRVMRQYYWHVYNSWTWKPSAKGRRAYSAGEVGEPLAWVFGDRYGVVTRTDEEWRVTWFNAADVPLTGRSILRGGGRVTLDLSQGQTEPLSADEVENLGLDK